ncbi:MAG: hypothetical protein ETSY2_28280 [Candidatus Entotheonella gemina]|uniref:Uncharacterized protein n=1 Tax=Candidatus Entotheonella gemina TaxID=1429439 RepID=W4M4G3_9BACT|nr:MAG: hypothetical protein ETSY2_28280 [Candidatus Entotheonella gemina]
MYLFNETGYMYHPWIHSNDISFLYTFEKTKKDTTTLRIVQ